MRALLQKLQDMLELGLVKDVSVAADPTENGDMNTSKVVSIERIDQDDLPNGLFVFQDESFATIAVFARTIKGVQYTNIREEEGESNV